MKTIKIILIVITLFVVGLLSIGLLVKETKYTTAITIEKPIDFVFTEFNNTDNFKEWIPEFKSIETVEEKLGKIGSTYKITATNNGQEIIMNEKILAFVPNEKVTLFYDTGEGSMLKTDDYVFIEKAGKTMITHKAICRSSSFLMACMFPIFKSKFKSQDQAYLDNLKVFLEQKK